MNKSTNILKAIHHYVTVKPIRIAYTPKNKNSQQVQGEKLEFFMKRLFSLGLDYDYDPEIFHLSGKIPDQSDIDHISIEKFKEKFSWLGTKNYPPDLKLKGGDCIEIKKKDKKTGIFSDIHLNSSPPRAKLKKDDPMLQQEMRTCENNWEESDVLYIIGKEKGNNKGWESLVMFYGDVIYEDKIYEELKNALRESTSKLLESFEHKISFEREDTKELGRLNKLGNNEAAYLRVRAMYGMQAPKYLKEEGILKKEQKLCAVMRKSKYLSFPDEDRANLEDCQDKGLLNVEESTLPDPIEVGKDIGIKIISVNH